MKFEKPKIEIIELEPLDVMTASGGGASGSSCINPNASLNQECFPGASEPGYT